MSNKITNCRGDEKKQEICREYDLKVISRMALLPDQKIECCCGELENEHTIFYYKHKASGYEDTFSVGKDCAKSLLDILQQPLPPLVDPLKHMASPPTGGGGGGTSEPAWPAINSELYTAINLWCIIRKEVPKYALQRILTDIQKSPETPLKDKDAHDFLKVLAIYKKTLKQMVDEAQTKHPNVKNYRFPILNSIASRNWIDLP
jgi:hypothetical protein